MNLVWQRFTLSYLSLKEFLGTSYLHRLVGLVYTWRQSSIVIQWGDIIAVALVSLVYALSPFVSNALVGLILMACGAFWLLLTVSDEVSPTDIPKFTPIHLLVLLYWGISTVATALSPVRSGPFKLPLAAFTGWQKLTLYLLLFALLARLLRSERLRSWLITLYLHVALIVSVYGMRQWFFGAAQLATWVDPESPLSKTTRVYSYLGNPNLLAGYILPAVVFSFVAFFAWQSRVQKALAATMFVVNTACLVVTFSRGGWIGLVVSFFVLMLLLIYWWSVLMPTFWRTWSLPIILGSVTSILVLATLFVEPLRERVLSIFAGGKDSSNAFRINVWTAVIRMIQDNPILGIGPGNTVFNKVYPRYGLARFTALGAYSVPLEIAVETGFIGLTCFLWLVIVIFNTAIQQLRRLQQSRNPEAFWLIAAIATMAGMLAHGLVDTVWYRPEVNTLWWFMVALTASFWRPQVGVKS